MAALRYGSRRRCVVRRRLADGTTTTSDGRASHWEVRVVRRLPLAATATPLENGRPAWSPTAKFHGASRWVGRA
jgi:hypothetical protein